MYFDGCMFLLTIIFVCILKEAVYAAVNKLQTKASSVLLRCGRVIIEIKKLVGTVSPGTQILVLDMGYGDYRYNNAGFNTQSPHLNLTHSH